MATRRFFTAGEKHAQARTGRLVGRPRPVGLHEQSLTAPNQRAQVHQVAQRQEPLLTVEEARVLLNVPSRQSIYRLVREQGMPVRNLGRYLRFDRAELEAWTVRQRERDAAALRVLHGGRS